MKDLRIRLLGIFQAEHADHLSQIRSILALAETVTGGAAREQVEEAFRRAHSLKGAARAVDIPAVERLAHRLETLFERVRDGQLLLDAQVSGVIHQALDASEDCMAAWGGPDPVEPEAALRAIDEVLAMPPAIPDMQAAPAEMAPATPDPATQPAALESTIPVQPAFQAYESVRVSRQNLDRVMRSAGQILTESLLQPEVTREVGETGRLVAEVSREWTRLRGSMARVARGVNAAARGGEGQRAIAEMVAETGARMEIGVRALAKQAAAALTAQQRSAWKIRNLSGLLQQDVWHARLAPAESLIEGFPKMVRDLARDSNKEIVFRVAGAEVQADLLVLQSLRDPVMHLLRNAISHGIESATERVAAGKPPAGALTLRLQANERRLDVTVEDDGRGVDLKQVAETAVACGLLSSGEADAASPEAIARVLFEPGFSTARAVTDLSGRGMGLSVVRESVRRLQGDVELKQRTGHGAAIHFSVPVSISRCHLVTVSAGGGVFAIPSSGVKRLCRVRKYELETIQGQPAVRLDERIYPLFTLTRLLDMACEDRPLERDPLAVMLLRGGGRIAAIVADAFLSAGDSVIHDAGAAAPASGIVTGAVLLPDGGLAIALNPLRLVEACSRPDAQVSAASPSIPPKAAASILVVDDSITTRMLEKSILEANGYRVRVAVDGIDALAQLQSEPADLVISDLQMPRLDGFGLFAALKQHPNLKQIPVIVVSSVEGGKGRPNGGAPGADAYILKRKFDHRELLEAIGQLL